LADTFKSKYKIEEASLNHYSAIASLMYNGQRQPAEVIVQAALEVLDALRVDSGTGPDLLPARILKECARVLAKPFSMLANIILRKGRWPEVWITHWIVPIYKRGSVYAAQNYRGVHLTAQLSKAMERLLSKLFKPFVMGHNLFGRNQFAYTAKRGARDVLALMAIVWITALAKNRKVAIYCSDVSGAFDRVSVERLTAKLKAKKLHPKIVAVMVSWLRNRKAEVIIGGARSRAFVLADMVFQGTVWGPDLWNFFYEDAKEAIQELSYTETVYADDLNAYREFPGGVKNDTIWKSLAACQKELHDWGDANQVIFDGTKESKHILSKSEAAGPDFKLLGVVFDVQLQMTTAVDTVVQEAGWKLKMLIRTRRFYTDAELVALYKAHLLAYIEYRTPAIYHAKRELLNKLDRVQSRFLKDMGIEEDTALMHFHLAPLSARRDMAMLGLLHRTVIGRGPPHFREHLAIESGRRIRDPRKDLKDPMVKRSVLGLIAVYNLLPWACRKTNAVSDFQCQLQQLLKNRLGDSCEDWAETLSPRVPLERHPLK
jgi:hypothetical protein